MNWKEIVSNFNDGDTSILKYFNNDYEDFFSLLKSKGVFHLLDPLANDSREWQNSFFVWLMENEKQEFYRYMEKIMSDIKIDENGNVFLILDEISDLASLFCDSRDISQETIGVILSGEWDSYDNYNDTTDNIYRDVIDELNDENLQHLYKKIISDLKGEEVYTETEELEKIAIEQNHPEYVEVNESNIARIVDDEETINALLDKYLDISGDLYSVHRSAYNSAYESEIYKNIWKELNDYFENGEWISKPHPYKKETTVYQYKTKIIDFETIVYNFLTEKYSGAIEDEGYFLRVLRESIECLHARIPDYPDYREVDKLINEYFGDYI